MNDIWTSAGSWMIRTAIGGGLLLLITCLLMRLTRQPVRRQRLGDWGIAAALVVALFGGWGPSWLVIAWSRVDPVHKWEEPITATAFVESVPAEGDFLFTELNGESPGHYWRVAPVPNPEHLADASNAEPTWYEQAGKIAMLCGAAVAAFFAIRLLLGYVVLHRLLWRSQQAPPEVRGLFDSMMAGTRWVRLLVSKRLLVPLSCGLVRPTVVLPASMCQPSSSRQLRWIFAHELTHLRRRDALSALLFNLGQVFFFALPWFWWLRRQVLLCQEYVADAVAAEQEGHVDYAEFLVSLANAPAVPVGASAVTGNNSDLTRRVAMLLNDPARVESRCPRLWNILVAGGLASLAVLLSGLNYRAEAAADEQVIIIIQSQDGKTNTKPLILHGAYKVDKDVLKSKGEEPVILWQMLPTVHGYGPRLDGTQDRLYKFVEATKRETIQLRVVDKTPPKAGEQDIIIEKVGGDNRWHYVVPLGDNLASLHEALQRLEQIKKEGKLTNERIEGEILKALGQMKAKRWQAEASDKESGYVVYSYYDVGDKKEMLTLTAEHFFLAEPQQKLRFGVIVDNISPAIAEHLKLPSKVGLMVTEVIPDSPAAKVGVKLNDVLIKIDGAMVPADSQSFSNLVGNLKSGTPLSVIVIRKGETVNIGNVTLEIEGTARQHYKTEEAKPLGTRAIAAKERASNLRLAKRALEEKKDKDAVTTTVTRRGDSLTITHKEGHATLIISCVIKDGKVAVGSVEIKDGDTATTYESISAVPHAHRPRVVQLVEALGKL